jgi:hypothetical protein
MAKDAVPRAVRAACASAAASLALAEDAGAAHGHLRYYTSPPALLYYNRSKMYLPDRWMAWVRQHDGAGGEPAYRVLTRSNATTLGAALRLAPPRVNRLMLVCHPDDELIFGGRELSENSGDYAVVAVTTDGVREFDGLCTRWGLGACGHLRHSDAFIETWDARIVADLAAVLAARRWEVVATHAAGGEYG